MKVFDTATLKSQIDGKTLVGYGAGWAALATMRTWPLNLSFIIDDNPKLRGQNLLNVPIQPSTILKDFDPEKTFIIVMAYACRSVMGIHQRLSAAGLSMRSTGWIARAFTFTQFESD